LLVILFIVPDETNVPKKTRGMAKTPGVYETVFDLKNEAIEYQ